MCMLTGELAQPGNLYVWMIDGQTINYQGSSFDLTMPDLGKYTLEVSVYYPNGDYVGTLETLLICK